MRRDEFNINDKNSIDEILRACEYGTLSLISEGKPYVVALNFVQYKNAIYFHGAKEGKKIEAIKSNPNAAFLVVKPYSFIPFFKIRKKYHQIFTANNYFKKRDERRF